MATIHVDVVSAEEQIFSGEAEFVVLPGEAGELGIYPRHTPLITRIKPGSVRIKVSNQRDEELIFVAGGILEVQPNVVTHDERAGLQLGNLFRITRDGAECLHRLPVQYFVTA